MAFSPLAVQFVLLAVGWRCAYVMLGALVLSLAVLPSLRYLRRRPEDEGLLPDGRPPPTPAPVTPAEPAVPAEEQWTLGIIIAGFGVLGEAY